VFKGWNFETYNNAFTKQVFSVRNHQVTFGLNIHHPSFSEGEVMLISHMEAAKELVGITADTCSYADIAVMVTTTYHTRFVGCTYSPCAVVLPEGFRANVATRRTFIPFEIAIDKILPGIMILGLMLP
jgi:hypothetical protein